MVNRLRIVPNGLQSFRKANTHYIVSTCSTKNHNAQ